MTMSEEYFEEEDVAIKPSKQTLLRIAVQLKPHWRWVGGFLLLIALVAGLDSFFTFLSKRIVDEGILGGNREVLINIVITYGSLILVQAAAVFGFIYLVGILGERIRYDLRQKMFNHLQNLSLAYYNRTPVGWIISRVTSDTDRVADLVTWGMLDTSWGIFNTISAVIFMLFINWQLALMMLLIIPMLMVVAAQFQKRIIREFRIVRKINAKITAAYNENISGVRVVKALGREEKNLAEFQQHTREMYRAGYRAAWFSALFLPIVEIISAVAVGTVIWYGGLKVELGGITIGGIQAFVSYIIFMMWPIQEMSRVFAEMQHALASAERIFALIDVVPDIKDHPLSIDADNIQGDIEFEHVSFAYDKDEPVLNDFNLYVKRGETIALVGATGGGKTTIVNLLCRFFEPTQGAIHIGGLEYRKLYMHALQSRIGMVLQTPHLFSGSIRENIRYGELNADDDEVEEAARLSGAHDFILTLQKRYETEVGEGGSLLSVGQKQLISLARAILAKPEIFIMDEATSAVDTLTEVMIQKGIENLMQGRTSFIIAHRLSTIKRAHRILVIEHGKIIEMGSHAELLRKRGQYFQLYTQQFRQELQREYDPLHYVSDAG